MENRLAHIDNIAKKLSNLFTQGYFLDISLIVGAHSIKCNRLLLAASSDYFHALLKFDNEAFTRDTFYLKAECLTPLGVQHVINYVNSLGSTYADIPVEEYSDVYAASSFLQVLSLQQRIRDLVISSLSIDNALWFLQFSAMFADQEISRRAMTILQDGFHAVDFASSEFLNLSPSQIEFIFLGDEINVPQEAFMVKSLLAWVAHDQPRRIGFFQKHFTVLLRLSMVSAEDLRQIVRDPTFENADLALCLLVRWYFLNYGSPLFFKDHLRDLSPKLQVAIVSNETTVDVTESTSALHECLMLTNPDSESARVGTDFRVYSVGGVEDEFLMGGHRLNRQYPRNTDFFAYSSNLKKMVPCPPLPGPPRIYHGVTASHTWIYVTGGELEDGTIINSCQRFNLVENSWCSIADLDCPRSHHGLACLDGIVYLFGGYCLSIVTLDATASNNILFYNHVVNRWVTVPYNLPTELVDTTIVASRDAIILIGGLERDGDDMRHTDSVILFYPVTVMAQSTPIQHADSLASGDSEAYEFQDIGWKRLQSLPRRLSSAAGVYHEPSDSIFVVGGRLATGSPSSEIFSYSFFQEQWSYVTSLATPRHSCSAIIHRDTFYVLGGLTLGDLLEDRWHSLSFDENYERQNNHQPAPNRGIRDAACFAGGVGAAVNVDHAFDFRLLMNTNTEPPRPIVDEADDGTADRLPSTSVPARDSPPHSTSSSTSISSTSSSWTSLFPRTPNDNIFITRVVPAPFRTCYIPEAWRIVNSSERPVASNSTSPLLALDPPDVPIAVGDGPVNRYASPTPGHLHGHHPQQQLPHYYDHHYLQHRRPRGFERDPFAAYWLEPLPLFEAMGWRRRGSTFAPTLRRVRCLARYCLAPLFNPDTICPGVTASLSSLGIKRNCADMESGGCLPATGGQETPTPTSES